MPLVLELGPKPSVHLRESLNGPWLGLARILIAGPRASLTHRALLAIRGWACLPAATRMLTARLIPASGSGRGS
eukprot:scaffold1422_cov297-Prasinococcus_capsulatus_cf.AAC.5